MRRLGATDRARLDRMKREADRLGKRFETSSLETALLDPSIRTERQIVRLLADGSPELRAELDRARPVEGDAKEWRGEARGEKGQYVIGSVTRGGGS